MRSMLLLPFPPATLPVALALRGSAQLAEPLAAALRCQWAFGFPAVPKPAQQLTHGFYQYPAGMQAVAAAHMLSLLPPGLLHDPFVGGGTTLVEGLRCGRHVIGADVSPLALFASTHHTWLASEDELEALRHDATSAISAVDAVAAPTATNTTTGAAGVKSKMPPVTRPVAAPTPPARIKSSWKRASEMSPFNNEYIGTLAITTVESTPAVAAPPAAPAIPVPIEGGIRYMVVGNRRGRGVGNQGGRGNQGFR